MLNKSNPEDRGRYLASADVPAPITQAVAIADFCALRTYARWLEREVERLKKWEPVECIACGHKVPRCETTPSGEGRVCIDGKVCIDGGCFTAET